MRVSRSVRRSLVVLGILAMFVVVVGALVSITFPHIVVPPQTATTSSLCTSTSLNSTVPTSVSGTLLLNCGGSPAFTVARAGSDTATFTVSSTGPASLGFTPHGSGCAAPTVLTSSAAVILSAPGGFDFCIVYSAFPLSGGTIDVTGFAWAS